MAEARGSAEDPENIRLVHSSPKVCGVWIENDKERGKEIFRRLNQDVARVDHVNLPFPWGWSKYSRYFALLSQQSLEEDDFMLCVTEVLYKLHRMKVISEVVLIIIDRKVKDLPDKLANLNFLVVNAVPPFPRCIRGLEWDTIKRVLTVELPEAKCDPSASLTVGDVGPSLAWSYFYGFLNLILPKVRDNIGKLKLYKSLEETYQEVKMSKQFIIVIPNSCTMPAEFKQVNEGNETGEDSRFPVKETFVIEESRAGHPYRHFDISVYEVKRGTGEAFYFCGGFANAVSALPKMKAKGLLNAEQMEEQRKSFTEMVKKIVAHKRNDKCIGQALFCTYDDKKESLADKLSSIIANNGPQNSDP